MGSNQSAVVHKWVRSLSNRKCKCINGKRVRNPGGKIDEECVEVKIRIITALELISFNKVTLAENQKRGIWKKVNYTFLISNGNYIKKALKPKSAMWAENHELLSMCCRQCGAQKLDVGLRAKLLQCILYGCESTTLMIKMLGRKTPVPEPFCVAGERNRPGQAPAVLSNLLPPPGSARSPPGVGRGDGWTDPDVNPPPI